VRVFYRLMKRYPPTVQDVLSQGALRQPCPRPHDPDFVRKWEGLSVFADEADVRALGLARNWKPGIYVATLHIPDDAPLTYLPPEHAGSSHWLLYDRNGHMLNESTAGIVLWYVVRIMHGMTNQEYDPRGDQFRVVE
jgi:hypothetical protein